MRNMETTAYTPMNIDLHNVESVKIGDIFQHDLDGRLVTTREIVVRRGDGLVLRLQLFTNEAQSLVVRHSNRIVTREPVAVGAEEDGS